MNLYELIDLATKNGNMPPSKFVTLRRLSISLDERQIRALEQIADALTALARHIAALDPEDEDEDEDFWE